MKEFVQSFEKLKDYCETEDFKGWDPYDGLNSKIFQTTPFKYSYILRLLWIQLFKRNPINLRKFMLVSKEYNPKGLGLFLSAYCNLYAVDRKKEYLKKIVYLADKLIKIKTNGYKGACWGYNFDWQARAFFLPKTTPTIVATSFIADALMNAYEITKENKYLDCALSSCDFIIKDLNRTDKSIGFIFSYSPLDDTRVYNASLLGSRLLARAYSYTKKEEYKELAYKSVRAVVDCQREDGAWVYGELKIQAWVDSFHTGYNLECIYEYQKYTKDNSFESSIEIGLKYYIDNFFLEDGTPKYYDKKVYPIDIHAPAQFIATLYKLDTTNKYSSLLDKVIKWTIDNMQDNRGYFYYQLKPSISSKIPYMRWAQAWMFYGMSFYSKGFENEE